MRFDSVLVVLGAASLVAALMFYIQEQVLFSEIIIRLMAAGVVL